MAKAKTAERSLRILALGGSCLSAIILLSLTAALAGGPTGGTVVSGSATISSPAANKTVVTQTSNDALINWNSFSIPTGSAVIFNQPGRSSLTVNRVTGPNSSEIDGQLTANGQVWILNANGILFGAGSQINVAGLLATTSDISDSNFQSGNYLFQPSANSHASVVNDGTIDVGNGGSVVLSAPSVTNRGLIHADLGNVVLGGTDTFSVDFTGDNVLRYQVAAPSAQAGPTSVTNAGTIAAAGGHVLMTTRAAENVQDSVINNTGVVEATSVSTHDGEIDLDAGPGGTANVGGTVDVSGTGKGETGGTITATGGAVNVADGAKLNASGSAGGGTILIGGGFHGKGPIANASATTVSSKATITADATSNGNGGSVAIWSSGQTVFNGSVSAKGGPNGGNGGFVETSGAQLSVGLSAKVDTTAPHGSQGTWLLDPQDITVESCGLPGEGGCVGSGLTNGTLAAGTDPGASDVIDPSTITTALGSTNVELQATQDITVNNNIIYSSANSLFLLAGRDINVNASIENTKASGGGNIELIAGWDQTTLPPNPLTASGAFGNNNGTVFIAISAPIVGSTSGQTIIAANALFFDGDISTLIGPYINFGNFELDLNGSTALVVDQNIIYGNANTLTLINSASISFSASLQNSGTGGINIVSNGLVAIGGSNAISNVSVGSAGGATKVAAGSLDVDAENGVAQLGFNGPAAVGDISVTTTGGITVNVDSGSYAQIGNGSTSQLGNITGNITVQAGTGISLIANNTTTPAFALIGNLGESGFSSPAGNISVSTAGSLTLDELNNTNELVAIGNYTGCSTCGSGFSLVGPGASGTTSITALDINVSSGFVGDISPSVTDDLSSGDVSLTLTGTQALTLDTLFTLFNNHSLTVSNGGDITVAGPVVSSGSGNATITSGGNITVEAPIQLGSGAVNITAAGTLTIGGPNTSSFNDVEVGSASGTTTVTTADLLVESDNGIAQLGFNGAGGGNINVTASGEVFVQANGGNSAQIGNGGPGVSGAITGNITVQGSDVAVLSLSGCGDCTSWLVSAIGNVGGAGGSESGNISVTASDSLTLQSNGAQSLAQIGNFSSQAGGNAATGNIMVSVTGGAASITADSGGVATIGDGQFIFFSAPIPGYDNSGTSGGNITVTAQSLSITTVGGPVAAIANYGEGSVVGNINVTTTGDITLSADDGDSVGIGLGAPCVASCGFSTASGNVNVQAGGALALNATGGGTVVIGSSNDTASSLDTVAANGDISLTTTGTSSGNQPFAMIGNFVGTGATGGGVVSVTSQTGSISLSSGEANSLVSIGGGVNSPNGTYSGSISVSAPSAANGNISLSDNAGGTPFIGSLNEGGTVTAGTTVNAGNTISLPQGTIGPVRLDGTTTGDTSISGQIFSGDVAGLLTEDIQFGNFALNLSGNQPLNLGANTLYGSANTLTLSNASDINIEGALQNSGTGAINITSGSSVNIGGPNALGNVAVGSASGTTTVGADALDLSGVIGFAQLGFGGAGSGNIAVNANSVSLVGGAGPGLFAQIGNGGGQVSASASGNITVHANSTVTLAAGPGPGSYVQIGNGGGQSNADGAGYSESGQIAVTAQSLTLVGGNGSEAYAQVGNGGYEVGFGLMAGTATISGNINVTVQGDVVLVGGGANDAYAQIGNGGDLVNTNASPGTSGSISGNITVAAAGSVDLQAGAGADSYVQIGDGGFSENAPNASSIGNFTTGGTINVSDLSLAGGTGGADAYAQVGNGDASKAGFANVSGDITIGFGTETLTDGTAPNSPALIGNATGTGEVSGSVTGGTINSPPVIGGLGSDQQSGGPPPPNLNIPTDVIPQPPGSSGGNTSPPPPGPLTQLADGTDNPDPNFEPPQPEDQLAATLGTSLDPQLGTNKTSYYTSTTIIPGLLKELTYAGSQSPQAVPGSSALHSSWGNESFWP